MYYYYYLTVLWAVSTALSKPEKDTEVQFLIACGQAKDITFTFSFPSLASQAKFSMLSFNYLGSSGKLV